MDDMLRVGIELRSAIRGASGGIVAVLEGVFQELFRRDDMRFTVFCTPFNRELLSTDRDNVEFSTLPLDAFFPTLDALARERRLDVIFRTYPGPPLAFPRQIVLVPDVQHEDHPEFFDAATLSARRATHRLAFKHAAAIATISDYAKMRIERESLSTKDVFVMRPSVPKSFAQLSPSDSTTMEREAGPERYFFFPANYWPAKNHDRLLDAVRRFRNRTGEQVGVVLTGALDGFDGLRRRHHDVPVQHLGYVDATRMRCLYERATALTFFSLYEGFGLPLLEAFDAGTPVVCSNRTSLPEVAGDAALMCDPDDVEAMSLLLEQVTLDERVRTTLVERGRARLSVFSWSEAAHSLADGLHRVAQTQRRASLAFAIRRGRSEPNGGHAPATADAPTELGGTEPRRRVTGYWADNWIESRLHVVLANGSTSPLRLVGVPATDMSVDVAVDGELAERISLSGGKPATIECAGPYIGGETISFSFSRSVMDASGRHVSFLVESTDLFGEKDLAQWMLPPADDSIQTRILRSA